MNGRRVEKDFYTVNEFLPLESEIPPLTFARERTDLWAPGKSLENFAVLHPGARWIRKRWPREQWIELGRKLAALNLPLTVSAGPDSEEVELAGTIANALGPAAITTEGKLSWPQLAGLLYRARLFVGVDTAAMHLAAACHCPTVAIFGASRSPTWRALAWNCSNREDMKRTVDAGLKLCKVLRLETAGLDNGAEKLSRRSKSKRELSAGGCVQAAVHVSVGYPSGQRGQTVNLLAYAYAGSNPAPTTTFFHKDKPRFNPYFTGRIWLSSFFGPCAFVLLASLADFSKTMLRKRT